MKTPRGSVLIVVLFVMVVLGLTGLSLAYRVGLEMKSVQRRAIMAKLLCGAKSAVAIAMARLGENVNDFDHPAEPWCAHAPLAGEGWIPEWTEGTGRAPPECVVDYHVIDEEGKLNVLCASSDALERIGLSPEQIAALFDWMDSDDVARAGGAENAFYENRPSSHRCKSAPLELLEELLLIRGFDSSGWLAEDANANGVLDPPEDDGDATYPPDNADGRLDLGWVAMLTCFGYGQINLNTAPGTVLLTLPLSDGAVNQILAFRAFDENSSGLLAEHVFRSAVDIDQLQGLTDADREVLRQIAAYRSEHFRIIAEARQARTGLSCRLEVVVRQSDGAVEILQWREGA